jgi:hypothetical protein
MINPKGMDSGDKQFIGALIGSVLAWWFFTGRKKYSVKGMH